MSTPRVANFNALPLELLPFIFNHVIRHTVVQERSLAALTLTHVCRSFRHVALDSPQLWTSLYRNKGRPKLAFIEACIERSKDEPLDVALQFWVDSGALGLVPGPEYIMVDSIIERILPHAARWRSCSWHMRQNPCDGEFLPYSDIRALFDRMDAPVLEELSIISDDLFVGILHNFRTSVCWNAPNLRTITLTNSTPNTIPQKFGPQIRSIIVNFHRVVLSHQLVMQRNLGKPFKSLTTLRFSLVDCCFVGSSNTAFAEFPAVKFVHIELLHCKQKSTSLEHRLWHEFRTFYFPNAIELDITLGCGDEDQAMLWNEYNIALYSLVGPTIAYGYRYPSLETLRVNVQSGKEPIEHQLATEHPESAIVLPTCCVPSLKHIEIRSTRYWVLLDSIGPYDSSQPPYFETGGDVVPIALETVTFDLPRLDGVVTWVKRLVSNMQRTGCWDNFKCLTVPHGGDDAEVIPRDDVEHWFEAF